MFLVIADVVDVIDVVTSFDEALELLSDYNSERDLTVEEVLPDGWDQVFFVPTLTWRAWEWTCAEEGGAIFQLVGHESQ